MYDIKTLAKLFDISQATLRRWYEQGLLSEYNPKAVSECINRYPSLHNHERKLTVNRAGVLLHFQHDGRAMNAAIADGSILPLADGLFLRQDLYDMQPHRFAVLPTHPDYTAVRQMPNRIIKAPQMEVVALDNLWRRRERNPYWQYRLAPNGVDGEFFLPDGYYLDRSTSKVLGDWKFTLWANALPYSSCLSPDLAGRVPRVFVNAYTTAAHTVLNLGILDDYGVMARSHGYIKRVGEWHSALNLALNNMGFRVPLAESIEAELTRVIEWLNLSDDAL